MLAADQVTKTWALHHAVVPRHVVGPLWFALTFNTGAAFGLARGVTPLVVAVAVVLVAWLLAFGRRRGRLAQGWAANVALGLVVGGAISNLADRFLRHHGGAVIDFIDALRIGDHDRWPVFNIADASIVVGALLLGFLYSRRAMHRG